MEWKKENRDTVLAKYLFLLINPILAFITAFATIKTKSSFNILFLLSIVFGISFTVPIMETTNNNLDAIRYRRSFENYETTSSTKYIQSTLYEDNVDFFDDIVYSLLGKITDNYHILFMVLAIIMSFFMLKSLKIFVLNDNFKISIVSFILLYVFLSNQIFNINAYRWYIALWITVCSILNIFIYGKKKYYLLLFLTPFIHSSYFVLYLFLLFYLIFSEKEKFLGIILIISLVFSFIPEYLIDNMQNLANYFPQAISNKILAYTSEEYMYLINESGSGFIWVRRLLENLSVLYITMLVYVMHRNYKTNIEHTNCKHLYIFLLIVTIFVNFTIDIPSLGSRFIMLTLPLIAYIWLSCFSVQKYNIWVYGLGILFVIFAVFPVFQFPHLLHYLKVLEPLFFINSPVVSFVMNLI